MINPYLGYQKFPVEAAPDSWAERPVSFQGRLSATPAQHLIASPGVLPHRQTLYLDPLAEYRHLSQLVGYWNGRQDLDTTPFNDENLRFYGQFTLIRGHDKREGQRSYQEWGFRLDGIEGLWGPQP